MNCKEDPALNEILHILRNIESNQSTIQNLLRESNEVRKQTLSELSENTAQQKIANDEQTAIANRHFQEEQEARRQFYQHAQENRDALFKNVLNELKSTMTVSSHRIQNVLLVSHMIRTGAVVIIAIAAVYITLRLVNIFGQGS